MVLHTHTQHVSDILSGASRTCRRATGFGGVSPRDDRGESEIIAVVLLIGVVVIAAGLLVVYGVAAVDERQEVVADTQAERAFEQFDTRASRVALGGESVQQVDFGLVDNEGHLYSDDEGWIRVVVTAEGGTPVEVTNTTLGTVYYKRGETVVASQGGGVWRADSDDGSAMLSRPEFHYTDQTLTLPIVSVDGDTGLADRVQVTKAGPTDRVFPEPASGLTNKIRSGTVNVTVQSRFYEAWGRYLEENVGGLVTYDAARQQVTVTFFGLPDIRGYDVGIIATSDTGELRLEGNGPNAAYIDSYNSSDGPYASSQSNNGSIRTAGDVSMFGNSRIFGDVEAGGFVDINSNAEVRGDVEWTTGTEPDATKITGEVRRIDGVPSVPPIDSFVTAYVSQIRQDNDNDLTPAITGNVLTTSGPTTELRSGDYYLHTLALDSETLVLNTTEGNVRIAVRDWVELDNANITVTGDGSVQVAVLSQATSSATPNGDGNLDPHFFVGPGSSVFVPDDRSGQFVVFGPSQFVAAITGNNGNNANFIGVVFAPAGTTGSGLVYVMHSDVYGLVMTGNLTANNGGIIHYDRGIQNSLTDGAPLSELDYLHVAVHRVRVTSR